MFREEIEDGGGFVDVGMVVYRGQWKSFRFWESFGDEDSRGCIEFFGEECRRGEMIFFEMDINRK